MIPLRVLIVDDEELARQRLRRLLGPEADVEVVGECSGGRDAIAAIGALAPDLVFLDVQMPEVDGFDVLKALAGTCPEVVFVSRAGDPDAAAWRSSRSSVRADRRRLDRR